MIAGSAVFLVGEAVGVPRVFTECDPTVRLRMLEERLGTLRAAQPLCALGPVIASVGIGYLALGAPSGGTQTVFLAASAALLVGSLAWARSVYLRTSRV